MLTSPYLPSCRSPLPMCQVADSVRVPSSSTHQGLAGAPSRPPNAGTTPAAWDTGPSWFFRAPRAAEQRCGLSVPSFPVSSSSLWPGLPRTGLPSKPVACRALSARVLVHWSATGDQACACSCSRASRLSAWLLPSWHLGRLPNPARVRSCQAWVMEGDRRGQVHSGASLRPGTPVLGGSPTLRKRL